MLHKMHKQYATKEIEKTTCNNDLLLFSTENFNKQQTLIPKRSHSHFSDFTLRRNQGLFSPKHFAQTCATSPRPLFFCGRISDGGRQGRHSCRVSSGDENGIVKNTAWLFTLERRFFTHIEREQQKNVRHTLFPLVVWLI